MNMEELRTMLTCEKRSSESFDRICTYISENDWSDDQVDRDSAMVYLSLHFSDWNDSDRRILIPSNSYHSKWYSFKRSISHLGISIEKSIVTTVPIDSNDMYNSIKSYGGDILELDIHDAWSGTLIDINTESLPILKKLTIRGGSEQLSFKPLGKLLSLEDLDLLGVNIGTLNLVSLIESDFFKGLRSVLIERKRSNPELEEVLSEAIAVVVAKGLVDLKIKDTFYHR